MINDSELSYLKHRGVTSLYHFTPIGNLSSIINYGICPREYMDMEKIDYQITDDSRSDGKYGYTSFSISYPNREMLMNKSINQKDDFAILEIDISVIGLIDSKRIIYSSTNAAAKNAVWGNGEEYLRGIFCNNMVDESGSIISRSMIFGYSGSFDSFPTDPQSEIQIHCVIPPEFIRSVTPFHFDPESNTPSTYVTNEVNRIIRRYSKKITVRDSSFIINPREPIKTWSKIKSYRCD